MLTIPPWIDPPAADAAPAVPSPRISRLALLRWPIALLVLLALLGAWRAGDDRATSRGGGVVAPGAVATSARSVGAARLQLPRDWREVARSKDRATWQAPGARHAVTLAHAPSSPVPLVAIVREVARDAGSSVAGARVVDGPTVIEPDVRLPQADSVVLLHLRVERGDGALLDVVQAWRRDSRAGIDVVATWTSNDGTWRVDPRSTIASADGS